MSFSKYHKGKTVCACVYACMCTCVSVYVQPPSFTACARTDVLHVASNKHMFIKLKCESMNG